MGSSRICPVPEVDVGVVTYNTRDITVVALQRVLDSEPEGFLRLLVHDNASSDGTPEAVRSALPTAELEVSASNVGFAAAMNRLIARSSSRWFLALNSDAWPEPGAIRRLIAAAEARPRAAALAPRIESPDGELEHSTLPFPSLGVAAITAASSSHRWWPALAERMMLVGAWRHDRQRAVDWAVGAALLMRRQAVAELGGFEEAFFMYAEDIDWCWRARDAGWEIWFEPTAVVRHLGNASGESAYGARRSRAFWSNTYRLYRRHHGRSSTAAFRVLNLMGCARMYALASIRGDTGGRAHWALQVRAHLARRVHEELQA
jgi:GT2 family glycosyltransferase